MAVDRMSATSAFMFQPAASVGLHIAPATSRSFSCSSGVGSLQALRVTVSDSRAGVPPAATAGGAAMAAAMASADNMTTAAEPLRVLLPVVTMFSSQSSDHPRREGGLNVA
ncbi:hypothetical protein GCM10010104_24830 [Streptomyces indiaensis]|uniref:Uncharacterized protein n=1 Tax=Streptomyces indiaensis TaxID=284033 RepID=A0ABN3DGE6_9ACTN